MAAMSGGSWDKILSKGTVLNSPQSSMDPNLSAKASFVLRHLVIGGNVDPSRLMA